MKEVAAAIKSELGLEQAVTIKEIIDAAVSETGLDHPQGSTLREQLLAIAEVCGIPTGTDVDGLD